MRYELYYWPTIQGRGEYVRLALEEAGADYVDVARLPEKKGVGMPALMRSLDFHDHPRASFAPPVLRAGELLIGQAPNILLYLGGKLGLAPRAEAGRLWVHQLQLTVADFVTEVHDTHHPVSADAYYEDQKKEAKRRAAGFLSARVPKFFDYFEHALTIPARRGGWIAGTRLSYADLSVFQLVEGMRYAFPRAMARIEPDYPALVALRDQVAARPNIAAYLASQRRIPFNDEGIFRHYPELDK
jgi:glutathione S-transferase